MEFGALICNAKNPKCYICPIKKTVSFFTPPKKFKNQKNYN